MADDTGPMPTEPTSITVDGVTAPLHMPFYYASLSNLWVFFPVSPKALAPYFAQSPYLKGFAPYLFGGKALMNVNFQNYTGHGGMMLETVNEVELNILSYPTARVLDVPMGMKLEDYLRGEDQTKTIGNLRLHVPADNSFAVAAGIALFGEPKFLASFDYEQPAPNNPGQKTWAVTCFDCNPAPDPTDKKACRAHTVFTLLVDTCNLDGYLSNGSPQVEYGVLDGRPIGSNWSMNGPFTSWCPLPSKRAKLSMGGSAHPMCTDMKKLLGRAPKAVAAQLFTSPPVAAEPRAYYVDIV